MDYRSSGIGGRIFKKGPRGLTIWMWRKGYKDWVRSSRSRNNFHKLPPATDVELRSAGIPKERVAYDVTKWYSVGISFGALGIALLVLAVRLN